MKVELQRVDARHPAAAAGAPPTLAGIDFGLASGEQVAVIGPSGAGKTTLLAVLACAMQPRSGTLRLDDADPWTLSRSALHALRTELCLAPQMPPLPPRQRVVTAVLAGRLPKMGLAASVRSLFYPSDIPGAHEALDRFDLADKLFERVDRLSGGERQRVGLARVLLSAARLWLVDEPLSALDPTRARLAVETLTGQARARGATLVTTLHDVKTALAQFPRVIGMRDGRIVFDRPSSAISQEDLSRLYAQHEHELIGAPPVPEIEPAPAPAAVMHCR